LLRPFRWQIGKAGRTDAAGEAAFDSSLDKTGREEGERDRLVDFAFAAALSLGDFDCAYGRIIDQLIEPTAALRY
jgi:hypothetical protein